jgi:hypothetical protein
MRMKILLVALLLSSLLGCKNKEIRFEKIIFQTSACLGNCPIRYLEVDSNRRVKLSIRTMNILKPSKETDSAKNQYFTGTLNETLFKKLKNELNYVDLDNLDFGHADCCDASFISITVYYNEKHKYFGSMFPPEKAHDLISILYDICGTKLNRTDKAFVIEAEK